MNAFQGSTKLSSHGHSPLPKPIKLKQMNFFLIVKWMIPEISVVKNFVIRVDVRQRFGDKSIIRAIPRWRGWISFLIASLRLNVVMIAIRHRSRHHHRICVHVILRRIFSIILLNFIKIHIIRCRQIRGANVTNSWRRLIFSVAPRRNHRRLVVAAAQGSSGANGEFSRLPVRIIAFGLFGDRKSKTGAKSLESDHSVRGRHFSKTVKKSRRNSRRNSLATVWPLVHQVVKMHIPQTFCVQIFENGSKKIDQGSRQLLRMRMPVGIHCLFIYRIWRRRQIFCVVSKLNMISVVENPWNVLKN